MTDYLLDTNILIRISDGTARDHLLAGQAVARLITQGASVYITSQNLVEFWAVATRPTSANGLGLSSQETERMIHQFMSRFRLLTDDRAIFSHWLSLVRTYDVKGKKAHDTRLVAVMLAYQLTYLLTFNTSDFRNYREINAIDPHTVIA